MDSKAIANGILRAVAIIVGILLLAYFLYLIQTVLVYLVVAAVVALIGRPMVLFLRRRLKFPNTLAVLTVILILLGIMAGLISLFIPMIVEQGKNLSLLDIDEFQEKLKVINRAINQFLGRSPLPLGDMIDAGELEKAEEQYQRIVEIAPSYEGGSEYLEHIKRKRGLRDNR